MMKQISAIALLGILAFGSIALAQKSANSAPQMKENMRPKQALRMELYVYETRLSGDCLLYTSPSPRDKRQSRMPSSA